MTSTNPLLTTKTAMYILAAGLLSNGLGILLAPEMAHAQQGVGELTDAMNLYLMMYGIRETFSGFLAVALTRDNIGTEAARAYFLLGVTLIFSPLQIYTVATSPGLNPDFQTAALAVQGFFAIYLPVVEYTYFSSSTTATSSSGKKKS